MPKPRTFLIEWNDYITDYETPHWTIVARFIVLAGCVEGTGPGYDCTVLLGIVFCKHYQTAA